MADYTGKGGYRRNVGEANLRRCDVYLQASKIPFFDCLIGPDNVEDGAETRQYAKRTTRLSAIDIDQNETNDELASPRAENDQFER
ncbi:MAG: hypothetical protein VW546_06875 [Gammaproteobacteria bacterium]